MKATSTRINIMASFVYVHFSYLVAMSFRHATIRTHENIVERRTSSSTKSGLVTRLQFTSQRYVGPELPYREVTCIQLTRKSLPALAVDCNSRNAENTRIHTYELLWGTRVRLIRRTAEPESNGVVFRCKIHTEGAEFSPINLPSRSRSGVISASLGIHMYTHVLDSGGNRKLPVPKYKGVQLGQKGAEILTIVLATRSPIEER